MSVLSTALALIGLWGHPGYPSGISDEGSLVLGGSPVQLMGKPTIRMVRQRVAVVVGEASADFDASFDLKNFGQAGYFRVGFPEMGRGFAEVRRRDIVDTAKRQGLNLGAFQAFVFFSLLVDGRAVETSPEASDPATTLRTKLIRFSEGQTHHFRVTFRLPLGQGATSSGGQLLQTGFDIANAGHWAGTVGETEVTVQVRNSRVKLPLSPVDIQSLRLKTPFDSKSLAFAPGSSLYYRGFAKPDRISIDTVRFYRKDFKPAAHQGMRFYFGYRANR